MQVMITATATDPILQRQRENCVFVSSNHGRLQQQLFFMACYYYLYPKTQTVLKRTNLLPNTWHRLLFTFPKPSKIQQANPISDVGPRRMMSHITNDDKNHAERIHPRVEAILKQDRNVLNFMDYIPSPDHVDRMKQFARTAPELYDHPQRTPRSEWFQHPRWHQNSQMPPFHIHFRTELQGSIRYLYNAYQLQQQEEDSDERQISTKIRQAQRLFEGCMRGLHGHVNIEEYACFPTYKEEFSHVDISFLYDDHKALHHAEDSVQKGFQRASLSCSSEGASSLTVLEDALVQLLNFDDLLMSHLGEEEEIVVPMSLTEKSILF